MSSTGTHIISHSFGISSVSKRVFATPSYTSADAIVARRSCRRRGMSSAVHLPTGMLLIVVSQLTVLDHAITFGDEVDLVWRAPRSATKYFFLLSRYMVPVGMFITFFCEIFSVEIVPCLTICCSMVWSSSDSLQRLCMSLFLAPFTSRLLITTTCIPIGVCLRTIYSPDRLRADI